MFHRRHRSASASASRTQLPTSGPAQSAAAQAFLANRPASSHLSSAAAAAAIRTMSPEPVPVHQTQTKRMVKRGSSMGPVGAGRGSLQRENSSGSMTERTFRTPSPSRPVSQANNREITAPPVPAIPRSYVSPKSQPIKSEKRSTSMEPPPRVLSPTLRSPAGRGASLDRRGGPSKKTITQRNTSLNDINELERTDSRDSVNFSRPLSPRPTSPSPNQSPLLQSRWAPDQSRNGVTAQQSEAIRNGVSESAQQPVKKKKKKVAPGATEGSHLSSGTTSGRTIVAAPDPLSSARREPTVYVNAAQQQQPAAEPSIYADVVRPEPIRPRIQTNVVQSNPAEANVSANEAQPEPVKKKKKKVVAAPAAPEEQSRPMSPGYSSDSDSNTEKAAKRVQRASGQLNKQPSVVREDWEGEQGNNLLATTNPDSRYSDVSPAGSPISAIKSKKPSTAANVSRKIDDSHNESNPVIQNTPVLAVQVPTPTADMPSSSNGQPAPKSYLDVVRSRTPQGSRQASLSPSRSKTRFSKNLSSDLSAERKHEPLPRSVSPAKSALKHYTPSPYASSPVDGTVPGAWRRSSRTPSEASDTTSMGSTEGLTSVPKKKKLARVSFEEAPEVVGISQTMPTDSPVLASPQNKDAAKKGWFSLGKKTTSLGTIPAEDDMEEVMKPRPMLPSFGSVRKNRDGPEPRMAQATYDAVTAPSSSEASSASYVPTEGTSVSSDHAIGAILTQNKGQAEGATSIYATESVLPIPPVVTTVEGNGYHSDTSASVYSQDESVSNAVPQIKPARSTVESEEKEVVPTIAVLPATPALEQGPDDMSVSLPGGFPVSADTLPAMTSEQRQEKILSDSSKALDSGTQQSISDPSLIGLGMNQSSSPDWSTSQVTPQKASPSATESFAAGLRERDEDKDNGDSDDESAVFSDAEEDLSYMDGDGFGSINAIVESPVVRSPANRLTTPPDSPSPASPMSTTAVSPTATDTASWDQAQAHWKEVAERRRVENAQTPVPGSQPQLSQPPKPKTKKAKTSVVPPTAELSSGPKPMRKSMKAEPTLAAAAPQMRSSMRSGQTTASQPELAPNVPFRSSMRSTPVTATQPEPSRQTGNMPAAKSKGALQKKHVPATAAAGLGASDTVGNKANSHQQKAASTKYTQANAATSAQPQAVRVSKPAPLQRTFSNGSESDSSFRKRRKGNMSADGKYNMKRSMRGGQADTRGPASGAVSPPPAGRGGVRSVSPVNRRAFSPVAAMRSSMRSSVDVSAPTVRNQAAPTMRDGGSHQRSSSSFSGFRTKSAKPTAAPTRAAPSKLKSRFVDSDDEDSPTAGVFQSRFHDSDSDEEPEPVRFRPVRGIPKKIDEGDSTDLEDSDDGGKEVTKTKLPASKVPASQVPASQAPVATTVPAENGVVKFAETLQSPTKEKKSFFGRFRSKKGKGDTPVASPSAPSSPLPKTMRDHPTTSAPERALSPEPAPGSSIAARSAMQNRRSAPQRIMSDSHVTSQRMTSDSWPLPPKIGEIDSGRPFSSDGVINTSSPSLAGATAAARPGPPMRQNTTSTVRTAGGSPVFSDRTGKKKKFPMLRRAFGLYD